MNLAYGMRSHGAADCLPMMSREDLGILADDIAKSGQREPIWLYRGLVLDGRNRLAACKIAKIRREDLLLTNVEDRIEHDEETFSPADFVTSLNTARRHLTVGQKAIVAAKLVREYQSEAAERMKAGGNVAGKGRTAEMVAKSLGLGVATVKRATRILKTDSKGLIGAVEKGWSILKIDQLAAAHLSNHGITELQVGQVLMALDPESDRQMTDELCRLFGLDEPERDVEQDAERDAERSERVAERLEGSSSTQGLADGRVAGTVAEQVAERDVERDVERSESEDDMPAQFKRESLADATADEQRAAAERISRETPRRDKEESRELGPADVLPLVKKHWSGMSAEDQRAIYEYVTKRCNPTGRSEIKGFDELTEGMAPELRTGLEQWLKYKTERSEGYKPTGMASLVRRVQQYAAKFPVRYVLKAMDESQAGGWKDFRHYFEGDLLEKHRGDIREMKLASRAVSVDEFADMVAGGE